MTTTPTSLAHKELISKHNTMAWSSQYGRVSVRKNNKRYIVRFEDFEDGRTTDKSFATLPGAMVAADTLRNYSL